MAMRVTPSTYFGSSVPLETPAAIPTSIATVLPDLQPRTPAEVTAYPEISAPPPTQPAPVPVMPQIPIPQLDPNTAFLIILGVMGLSVVVVSIVALSKVS